MKILKQGKNNNQIAMEIEEEYSKLAPHIEKAYKEVSHEVKIPGFRQGKIPSNVLKKYINEDAVLERAVQSLVSELYPVIIEEAHIKPVDYPNIDITKVEKDKIVGFTVKVDVYPEIKLGNYKGLSVKRKDPKVQDSEVDHTINFIKKNYATQSKLKEEDVVLDDEFAKKVSRLGTFEELRNMIKTNIETEKKMDSDAAIRDDITKLLAEAVTAEIPDGMIMRETDTMINDLENNLKRNRMTVKSYLSAMKKDMDQLKADMRPAATTRVKAKLALETIIEKEKLAVDGTDIDKELGSIAAQAGKSVEEYRKDLSQDVIESIKEYILREKAIDFVVSKAKIEEAA